MARKQTRRSLSISGPTYETLKKYCDSTNQSISGVTEGLIKDFLDGRDAALGPSPVPARPRGRKKAMNGGGIFTF